MGWWWWWQQPASPAHRDVDDVCILPAFMGYWARLPWPQPLEMLFLMGLGQVVLLVLLAASRTPTKGLQVALTSVAAVFHTLFDALGHIVSFLASLVQVAALPASAVLSVLWYGTIVLLAAHLASFGYTCFIEGRCGTAWLGALDHFNQWHFASLYQRLAELYAAFMQAPGPPW